MAYHFASGHLPAGQRGGVALQSLKAPPSTAHQCTACLSMPVPEHPPSFTVATAAYLNDDRVATHPDCRAFTLALAFTSQLRLCSNFQSESFMVSENKLTQQSYLKIC